MDYFRLLGNIYIGGKEIAPRGLKIRELLDQKLIIDKYNFIATEKVRPFDKITDYLYGELAWYFSGDRRADLIRNYSKFWEKIKNEDGTLNSNYGNLVFYKKRGQFTPFDWALKSLADDKLSRQALMLYNDREFMFSGNKDFICTQYQHFLIRDSKLICIIGLRSSDAIFGLTYNMPWWSIVHQQLRLLLLDYYPDLEIGKIIVNISSAHLYEQHFKLAIDMITDGKEYYWINLVRPIPIGKEFEWYEKNIKHYLSFYTIIKYA